MNHRTIVFADQASGAWAVRRQQCVAGLAWPVASRIAMLDGPPMTAASTWWLRGISSNDRYVVRDEKRALLAQQEGLGRATSSFAALIPIRKSPAWWAMTQDERRAIFEEQSRHIQIGMRYLPAISRKLLHCRDLSESEPFDFLTWFEYAPAG